MKRIFVVRHLWLTAILLLTAAVVRSQPLPFEPGEALFYEVRWENLPVAKACLTVRPFTEIKGEQALHFVFQAQTYPAMDFLYPVRGQIEAFTDVALTRSLGLAKDMQEGRSRRRYRVDFDWQRDMATYDDGGPRKRRLPLTEGMLDIVSILYYARSLPLAAGLEMTRPFASGKKSLVAEARVVGHETVLVDGRSWQAFRIEPDVRKAGGVFAKSKTPRLELWISDDERKIPLRVVGKVWVGSFIAELIGESPGKGPGPAEPAAAGY